MERVPVQSTNIAELGWEDTTLFILFNNGSLYTYGGVPKSVFKDFCNAPSVGKYFHTYIKDNYEASRKDQDMADRFRGMTSPSEAATPV